MCGLCDALAREGVTDRVQELSPPSLSKLRQAVPSKKVEAGNLLRCPECGAIYRYRHHYEYNALGPSWDEDYAWRATAEAQPVLQALVDAASDARDRLLAEALHHPSGDVRDCAGLVGWLRMEGGEPLEAALPAAVGALRACAEPKDDRRFFGPIHAYHLLLAYLRRGPDQARRALAALEAGGMAGERYGTTLATACRRLLPKA